MIKWKPTNYQWLKAVLETGLFAQFSESKKIYELRNSGYFIFCSNHNDIIGSQYIDYLSLEESFYYRWETRVRHNWIPVTFERVFDSIDEELQQQLLFHLDLFR